MVHEVDIAWSAGVFDGEGCIHVHRSRRKAGRTVPSITIILANTSAELIERYRSILIGIGVAPRVDYEPRYTKTPMYYVKVARKHHALVLLRALAPQLTAKRAQALLAIDYLERSCRARKYVATVDDMRVLGAISAAKSSSRSSSISPSN